MHASCNPAPNAGTIYGVVLNDRASLERMGSVLTEAPYKAEPRAPVLYIKPANTRASSGASATLPAGHDKVEIGATLGIVIGAPTYRASAENAKAHIAGYVVAADLSLPHASYYRPAIREKCFDGSCVLGDTIAADRVADPASLEVRTLVNGREVDQFKLCDLVRSVPELLRDVSEFMTLATDDILLIGVKWQAPTASPGDEVTVTAGTLGEIRFSIDQHVLRGQA